MIESYIVVGEIVAAFGIQGQVKIKTFTEKPEKLLGYKKFKTSSHAEKEITISNLKVQGPQMVIARIQGCDNRTLAETYIGHKLLYPRDSLPTLNEDEFYYDDLKNLLIIDHNDKILGQVQAIHDYGAGVFLDIYLTNEDKVATLPFHRESIKEIDLKEKKIIIDSQFLLI